jgi:hypothetical protein
MRSRAPMSQAVNGGREGAHGWGELWGEPTISDAARRHGIALPTVWRRQIYVVEIAARPRQHCRLSAAVR